MRSAAKTELRPLPKSIRDTLSLEYHLQLEVLRAGAGSLIALQLLMRVALAVAMLSEMGYDKRGYERRATGSINAFHDAAYAVLSVGDEGRFAFNENAYLMFANLLTDHNAQLEIAPVCAIDLVAKRLEQYS